MVPEAFNNFFFASAGIGATLVGLIFVAVSILIIKEPDNVGNFYTLAVLLLAVYGIGLTRAWQLLGARRFGLGTWLSPLLEVNETNPIRTQEESRTPGKTAHDD